MFFSWVTNYRRIFPPPKKGVSTCTRFHWDELLEWESEDDPSRGAQLGGESFSSARSSSECDGPTGHGAGFPARPGSGETPEYSNGVHMGRYCSGGCFRGDWLSQGRSENRESSGVRPVYGVSLVFKREGLQSPSLGRGRSRFYVRDRLRCGPVVFGQKLGIPQVLAELHMLNWSTQAGDVQSEFQPAKCDLQKLGIQSTTHKCFSRVILPMA